MKSIRNFFRKLKYRSKFLGKKKEDDYYYITRGNVDNQLTELMNTYGSDKGGRNNHHNFSNYYSELFFHKKNLIKNFLEVGLGTNDTNVLSNMGPEGKPLASLRAWRDYFQNANIYAQQILLFPYLKFQFEHYQNFQQNLKSHSFYIFLL